MTRVVCALPGNEALASSLGAAIGASVAPVQLHRFPDGESLIRVDADVRGADVVIAATLHQPDQMALPLYFLACTLRELGAARIFLVAPYLAYMRQDRPFHPGEGTSAVHFARWLSSFLDGLITIDPHLHRIHALSEVYSIPALALKAAPEIARWLRENVPEAVLIGPDAESEQWVAAVAQQAGIPFTVLEKTRRGDADVSVTVPHVERWRNATPVLVDDIISTGHTMAAAAEQLRAAGMRPPLCIGVHAVFSDAVLKLLQDAGVGRLMTCNTIMHPTNAIDLNPLLAAALSDMLAAPQRR